MAYREFTIGMFMIALGLGIGLTLRPAVELNGKAPDTSTNAVDAKLQAKVDRLEAAIEELSRPSSARPAAGPAATQERVSEPVWGVETRPDGLEDPSPIFDSVEDAIAAEQKFVEHTFGSLEDALKAEPLDGPWAIGQESEITEQLENGPDSTTRLVDVQCQSTLCRIELEHEIDEVSHEVAMMALTGPMFAGSEMLSRRVESPQGEVRTELFLSRKDHRLPRMEDAFGE
ncbi:MAG: hypothetical protein AB8G23_24750 [Myxococcota bacterium]